MTTYTELKNGQYYKVSISSTKLYKKIAENAYFRLYKDLKPSHLIQMPKQDVNMLVYPINI